MYNHVSHILYADLETTVYEGQTETAAWSSAFLEDGMDEPLVFNNLKDSYKWLKSLNGNLLIYYHNLKYDGFYWIDYFLRNNILRPGYINVNGKQELKEKWKLYNREFTYNISSKGYWYNIIIKQNNRFIEFRDSLKLIPFKLKKVGEDFKTKHQKLEMDFEGKPVGYVATAEEKEYIKNDAYVLKEAMEKMAEEGHTRMTIGSCCLNEFKTMFDRQDYDVFFPNIYQMPLASDYFDKPINFNESVGEYIYHSYRGAFCDVGEQFKKRVVHHGYTLDVTSLYSSVMHSKSGNRYPIGKPKFWKGNLIPEEACKDNRYFFVRFRCAFTIKPGYLPFIQLKGDWHYKATEHLKTSAVYSTEDGLYHDYLASEGGRRHTVEITMCEDEYYLFLDHYEVKEMKILDGCYFYSEIGLFDEYINKYFKIKSESKGAIKTIAKLFLNNLYGKFATSPDSSYKIIDLHADGLLHYSLVNGLDKEPGYIPIGSAITAKARCFTIRAAQLNIDRFCYCDTDSIHLLGDPSEAKGVKIAENELCTWKLESTWATAYFTRQKTYIEIGDELTIKCAGMPDRCKDLFAVAAGWKDKKDLGKLDDIEAEYIKHPKKITDFDIGLIVPSKLYQKVLPGGVLLYKNLYQMR